MKKKTKISLILTLIALLIFITIVTIMRIQNEKMITHELGTANRVGEIGVILHYDTEPVDIILESPSGETYECNSYMVTSDGCILNKEKKTQTIIKTSNEKGLWKITFNKKFNRNITYDFINKSSDKLLLDDLSLYKTKDKKYQITVTPVFQEPTDTHTTFKYTLILSNRNRSMICGYDDIKINQTKTIKLNIDKDIKESLSSADDWSLVLTVYDENNSDENHTASYVFNHVTIT